MTSDLPRVFSLTTAQTEHFPSQRPSVTTTAIAWISVSIAAVLIVVIVCSFFVWRTRYLARWALLRHHESILSKDYAQKSGSKRRQDRDQDKTQPTPIPPSDSDIAPAHPALRPRFPL
ncbi:hypothetical protein N7493_007383 [Penicillium malachiteum]|uniref:Uncharacterized protein n=1 Tax=Penicillium malachiteum TaxID=1324776 RepID=A0AAD6HJ55_9EURO|nr:hypothetical protein N7493_007383 [Penicillium malachiteum]